MKIRHLVASIETRHGGPSVSVPGLTAAQAGLGHDARCLVTGPVPEDLPKGQRRFISSFERGWPDSFGRSGSLGSHVRGESVDIWHHHGLWLRTLHYAHQKSREDGVPLVVSPRGMMAPWAWNHHRWQKALAAAFIHPRALAAVHGWHATSEAEVAEIRAQGFHQPVCVAPNGVSAPSPVESDSARTYWQRMCPETTSRPVALFYSRFHPKKRVIELIDLWIERAPRDWLLLVVGIPGGYGVEELRRRAASADERIRVFDGTATPPPYSVASVLLLPSHNENFGLVVAEALANGLPAVVTDTTPWQILETRGIGWCVPWNDFPEAMNDALAAGPGELRKRGAAAAEWVLATYSWETFASTLVEFYASLTQRIVRP